MVLGVWCCTRIWIQVFYSSNEWQQRLLSISSKLRFGGRWLVDKNSELVFQSPTREPLLTMLKKINADLWRLEQLGHNPQRRWRCPWCCGAQFWLHFLAVPLWCMSDIAAGLLFFPLFRWLRLTPSWINNYRRQVKLVPARNSACTDWSDFVPDCRQVISGVFHVQLVQQDMQWIRGRELLSALQFSL